MLFRWMRRRTDMPEKILISETHDILTSGGGGVLRQRIPFGGAWLELGADFISRSFAEFPETLCFVHKHPYISRFILVESGQVTVWLEGRRYEISANEAYLLPAGICFETEYRRGSVCKGFHLHLFDGRNLPVVSGLDSPCILRDGKFAALLSQAIAKSTIPSAETLVFYALIQMLEKQFPMLLERLVCDPFYEAMLKEVKAGATASLRLESFAQRFHRSPAALSKGFYRTFGISWKLYQQTVLLRQARELLSRPSLSVAAVADQLGFRSEKYFFAFYRKMTGQTPMFARKQLRTAHLPNKEQSE